MNPPQKLLHSASFPFEERKTGRVVCRRMIKRFADCLRHSAFSRTKRHRGGDLVSAQRDQARCDFVSLSRICIVQFQSAAVVSSQFVPLCRNTAFSLLPTFCHACESWFHR